MKIINNLLIGIFSIILFNSCGQSNISNNIIPISKKNIIREILNPAGKTIATRINAPEGFVREKYDTNSFEYYLRNLPLKPVNSKVHYYDGTEMTGGDFYIAVVDMDIGKSDLQQCADAIIRLRAEYLYKQKQYDKIHFNFTSGFRADYKKWAEGSIIRMNGNKASWIKSNTPDYSYRNFRKYLDVVFSFAGTFSLSKELKAQDYNSLETGDVFIRGGFPGHSIIVVDVAINPKTGKKLFLLAQSFTPAQDIHVLKNIENSSLSPWYEINVYQSLNSPEWSFQWNELKRFEDK